MTITSAHDVRIGADHTPKVLLQRIACAVEWRVESLRVEHTNGTSLIVTLPHRATMGASGKIVCFTHPVHVRGAVLAEEKEKERKKMTRSIVRTEHEIGGCTLERLLKLESRQGKISRAGVCISETAWVLCALCVLVFVCVCVLCVYVWIGERPSV